MSLPLSPQPKKSIISFHFCIPKSSPPSFLCDLIWKVTLEAEVTNKGALALYGRLGFIRAKRLFRYYLNGVDAFRLKLLLPRPEPNYSDSQKLAADEDGEE